MAALGNLALDGGDPRLHGGPGVDDKGIAAGFSSGYDNTDTYTDEQLSGAIRPQMRKMHDSSITYEEYAYYAARTRQEEDMRAGERGGTGIVGVLVPGAAHKVDNSDMRKASATDYSTAEKRSQISEEEWTNASRALRTATTSAIFFLITTDILGPFGLPYAFASMGWGPGVALFTVFGGLAAYSGYLLYQCFCGLDSYHFPVRSYGDLGFRLYGNWVRILFNILQSIQLVLNVGSIIISNGEALSQAVQFKLCYVICTLVWAIAGFVFGQVRTLKKFSWLANLAVWINLGVMAVTMYAAYRGPPNYQAADISAGFALDPASVTANGAGVFPGVAHSAGLPASPSFAGSVNGAMQAVFSYGGAMIFPEFLSEARRPRDFLKGMWAAQLFIYVMYMVYGLFMYAYQGQYVVNPSYLGVGEYTLQTIGNSLAMASALIAAALYGNIGIKVLYNNIFVELFHAPPLTTRGGKFAWLAIVPVYWSIAFIIAAAIPGFSGLTGIVAAICILQFTYTFPPMLAIAFMIKRNAMQEGEGFDPQTGEVIRHDKGLKRMVRGFFAGKWYMNVFNLIYMLGALTLAGLGAYGSIENLIGAFAAGAANSFSCHSPLDGAV